MFNRLQVPLTKLCSPGPLTVHPFPPPPPFFQPPLELSGPLGTALPLIVGVWMCQARPRQREGRLCTEECRSVRSHPGSLLSTVSFSLGHPFLSLSVSLQSSCLSFSLPLFLPVSPSLFFFYLNPSISVSFFLSVSPSESLCLVLSYSESFHPYTSRAARGSASSSQTLHLCLKIS